MTALDFRTRVAAERRERMRSRLIAAAMEVFSSKDIEAIVIEDLIEQAQVSRGTFYNYFRTTEEVITAVLQALSNELLSLVEIAIADRPDAAERMACGVRMVLHAAKHFPQAGRFISRVGVTRSLDHLPALGYLLRDLVEATEAGRFSLAHPTLGLDLVVGTANAALFSLGTRADPMDDYPEEITFHILLGLGMTRDAARELVDKPIQAVELPPDSLLVRTHRKPPGTA